jgi:hypothetical protein
MFFTVYVRFRSPIKFIQEKSKGLSKFPLPNGTHSLFTLHVGASAAAASILTKRKHACTHIVFLAVSLTAVVVATPAKAATMVVPRARPKRGQYVRSRGDNAKQSGDNVNMKETLKRSGLPPPALPVAKIGASQDNDIGAANVFVEKPPRYNGNNVPNSFTDMLNEAKVSITESPLDAYEVDG